MPYHLFVRMAGAYVTNLLRFFSSISRSYRDIHRHCPLTFLSRSEYLIQAWNLRLASRSVHYGPLRRVGLRACEHVHMDIVMKRFIVIRLLTSSNFKTSTIAKNGQDQFSRFPHHQIILSPHDSQQCSMTPVILICLWCSHRSPAPTICHG